VWRKTEGGNVIVGKGKRGRGRNELLRIVAVASGNRRCGRQSGGNRCYIIRYIATDFEVGSLHFPLQSTHFGLPVRYRLACKLLILFGSPVWTRFEFLHASWHCDRTNERATISARCALKDDARPYWAPSLDMSRTAGSDVPKSPRR
jgi:hypothetical protein